MFNRLELGYHLADYTSLNSTMLANYCGAQVSGLEPTSADNANRPNITLFVYVMCFLFGLNLEHKLKQTLPSSINYVREWKPYLSCDWRRQRSSSVRLLLRVHPAS
ncbi:hypothetical protein HanXRQr2_Chr12g0548401 [Helianthus annuus]|uniref:Uncharacterized protein n=1 Tax=Helianthus annuus TaxID=4232 RepID=A0A9K3HHP6_HELAN|nr:hypothetical protein HanXRQr2_Chr12g0548401 [Helianthus annuus]KAJ0489911.1 hypothetical protein HanHA300_Chr12g0449361 [Helianthus annuus]KAJ0493941.1 hypothetical protein HanIR_Chr12g0591781 [Helianthus annuus]KAJ0675494.1 hypothetical protein HanLR1_Chr12g0451811 [Helianthus annuus]KAJ0678784.1 hypothetical protein HanOQP8_Chr12g0451821 [Helianthus annuus]